MESNSFSAAYGRSAAVVNVATKSGTNQFHGTAFEFLRNDKLDARNFFALSRPPYKRNQFGGSLGGPILRNKLFFFGDYEGTRIRQGRTFNNRAANSAVRAGNFAGEAQIFDPLTIRPNPSGTGILRDPFPDRQIPSERISPVAKYFLPFIPEPNAPGDRFVYSPSLQGDTNQADARVDYKLRDADSLFGRYSFEKKANFNPGAAPQTGADSLDVLSQNAMLGHVHVFSSAALNEARLTFSRLAFRTLPQGLGKNYTVESGIGGFELTSVTYPGFPTLSPSGYLGVNGRIFRPIRAWITGWQFTDNFTYVRGAHTLKFGFDTQRKATPTDNNALDRGLFSFSGGYSGNGFADFLLGYPNSAGRGFPRDLFGVYSNNYATFVQDDWRVSSRLTLNLGLRYEVLPPQRWIRNVAASYDFLSLTKAPGKLALANDSEGRIDLTSQRVTEYAYPFVADIVISAREAGLPDNLVYTNWRNVAPRLGLAWTPRGKATVIRAGAGVFYLLTPGIRSIGSGPINMPLQVDESLSLSTNIAPSRTIADLFPPFGQNFVQPLFSDLDPHQATPYMFQWNLAIQHQLTRTLAVEVAYTGNSAHKLEYTTALNIPRPGPGSIAARRPDPRVGIGAYLANIGYGNFNSFKLRAEQRFSRGLAFLTTYVYGKAIDSNTFDPSNGGPQQDPDNLRAERGRSDSDVAHRLVASAIYELPFGKGKRFLNSNGIAGAVLGGWRLTSFVTLQGGLPFTPSIFGDPANTGRAQRPDRLASGRLTGRSVDGWYDLGAFAIPAAYTYGNSGRNIIEAPGLRNWDFGLHREIPIREDFRLQFRAEFFNFTNTPAFGRPDAFINSPTASRILTAGEPRDIQLSVKLIW